MTRCAIYRHFDAGGQLLYVGISHHPQMRDKQHAASSIWHAAVARTETEWCESRDDALVRERQAVVSERPRHNIQNQIPAAHVATGAADVTALIGSWPRRKDFADAIGVDVELVHKWAKTGRIPSPYMAEVVEVAQAKGLSQITADWMVRVHDRRSHWSEAA